MLLDGALFFIYNSPMEVLHLKYENLFTPVTIGSVTIKKPFCHGAYGAAWIGG